MSKGEEEYTVHTTGSSFTRFRSSDLWTVPSSVYLDSQAPDRAEIVVLEEFVFS